MPIHEILNCFHSKDYNRVFVLGIDGLGGSGKTTYAQSIEKSLINEGIQVEVLHIDDFIHPKEVRYNKAIAEWDCYYNLQWRYDYLIKEILAPTQLGNKIDKQIELYDKLTDSYFFKHIKMKADSILLMEGVFLQRDELRPYLDYVIFIDVPKEERLHRVLKRDTYIGDKKAIFEKYEKRYFPAEEKYIKEYTPAKKANFTKKVSD